MKGEEGECLTQRKKRPKYKNKAKGSEAGGIHSIREHQ